MVGKIISTFSYLKTVTLLLPLALSSAYAMERALTNAAEKPGSLSLSAALVMPVRPHERALYYVQLGEKDMRNGYKERARELFLMAFNESFNTTARLLATDYLKQLGDNNPKPNYKIRAEILYSFVLTITDPKERKVLCEAILAIPLADSLVYRSSAQFELAKLFFEDKDEGVRALLEPNNAQAAKYLQAILDDPKATAGYKLLARYHLGRIYDTGMCGGRCDKEKAKVCYKKALNRLQKLQQQKSNLQNYQLQNSKLQKLVQDDSKLLQEYIAKAQTFYEKIKKEH